jgi:hypothetical protein
MQSNAIEPSLALFRRADHCAQVVVKAKFREDDMVAQAPPPRLPHPAPTCNPPRPPLEPFSSPRLPREGVYPPF